MTINFKDPPSFNWEQRESRLQSGKFINSHRVYKLSVLGLLYAQFVIDGALIKVLGQGVV